MKTLNAEVQHKPCDNILGGSMKVIALCALLLIPNLSRAEDGPGSGNGGNLVRIDVVSVINQIRNNCDKWNSIRFMQKDDKKVCELLREKMDAVGTKEKLKISPSIPKDRTGENFPEIPSVSFSEKKWTANKDNTVAKIGIVLHELLGLLGLEGTDEYHISNGVMNELRSVSLLSSDNPNFMATMVKVDAMRAKARDCSVKLSDDDRRTLAYEAIAKLRAILHSKQSSKEEKKVAQQKWDPLIAIADDVNSAALQYGSESYCKNRPAKKSKAQKEVSDLLEDEDSSSETPAN